MHRVVADIQKQFTVEGVFQIVGRASKDYGARSFSYHFTPPFTGQTAPETTLVSEGFPKHWIELYEDNRFRLSDPIPDFVMQEGQPVSWDKVMREEADRATKEHANFFRALEENGIVNGIGLPLFGPRNRNAYASFGLKEPLTPENMGVVAALHAMMDAAHLRVCSLMAQLSPDISLSNREAQVMFWISQGKSNGDIATIIGISPDTVATYIKRLYQKLDASDRVGATVKSLQLGLIDLQTEPLAA